MSNEDNGYAPCCKLLKEAIKNEDDAMSPGGRLFLGALSLIGTVTIDPVIWVTKKLGIEGDGNYDPNDTPNY